jgi:hypothetical protein
MAVKKLSTPDCPMCKAGIVGRNHTKNITLGKQGALENACSFFGISPIEVMEHCNTHEITIDEAAGIYESNDFYMDRVLKMVKRLDGWMDYLETKMNPEAVDLQDMKMGLLLIRESRETIKDLATFQGRLENKGNTTVKIETLNAQYNQLTQIMMSEVCDTCRERIIKLLDTQTNAITVGCKEI